MRLAWSFGILLLLLMGCKDHASSPVPGSPYEQWRTLAIHDYTIDQVRECYCAERGRVMTLTVRADTIASMVYASDSTAAPVYALPWYCTIDSLFAIIRNSTSDSLVIVYNAEFGYPETLDINPQAHPIDGGVLYRTTNLRVP